MTRSLPLRQVLPLLLLLSACKKDDPSGTNDSEAACGDGTKDAGEQCDDGNADDGDGCQADCTLPSCGDGILDPWEACDAGTENADTPDAPCRPSCELPSCGDGIADAAAGEICDDGNLLTGDGCAPDCQSDERCGNGILDVGEPCDDGNALSHDGCSSDCALELPQWERYDPQPAPPTNVYTATWLATDAARGEVIAYADGATWKLDGAGWHHLTDSGPLPSGATAVAPFVSRGELVLFGGSRNGQNHDETWVWNGATWRRAAPAQSPAARNQHQMAYDAERDVVVMFGGFTDPFGTPTQEVWEWDGVTWTERTASPAPTGLPTLAYDPVRGQVLASDFGTWAWDGTAWTDLGVGSSLIQAMAWDPVRERMVGAGSSGIVEWDGTAWTASLTGQLDGFVDDIAWDPQREAIVLLRFTSVETWDGTTLAPLTVPVQSPEPRRMHSAAYHGSTGNLVLAGGVQGPLDNYLLNYGNTLRTSWTLGPDGWRQTPDGPIGIDAGADYHVDADELVLFPGGVAGAQEIWTFDGTTWAYDPATPPSTPHYYGDLAWDPVDRNIVYFGGKFGPTWYTDPYGNDFVTDTWAWDGAAWSERLPLTSPSERAYHDLVTDHAEGRIATTGGQLGPNAGTLASGDLWHWHADTSRWEVGPNTADLGKLFDSLAYDAHRQRVVRHGGFDPSTTATSSALIELDPVLGWVYLGSGGPQDAGLELTWHGRLQRMVSTGWETWMYGYGPVRERCTTGLDGDNDGLAGCDDPDCWGFCTPTCPPGASCDPTEPTCGDGVCNDAIESSRLCPADCGAVDPVCGDYVCDPGETGCPGDCG